MSIYFLFSPGETTIKFQIRKHDLISAALWKVSIFKQSVITFIYCLTKLNRVE